MPKHFLTLQSLTSAECHTLVDRAIELKKDKKHRNTLSGKMLGLVFEKSSTRTRVSFEVAMNQLGGGFTFLSPRDTQLGRGEPIADTARVLSRMLDCIVVRANSHETIETFAKYSQVPVINALTDLYHPCQLLSDMQTYKEHRGSIKGKKIAWIGDGNNMCHSYMNAAQLFDFELAIATPPDYQPDVSLLSHAKDYFTLHEDPKDAVQQADLVVTDVWISMGQEEERKNRLQAFSGFQVDETLMSLAAKDAVFMHCLPAYRGYEVSEAVLEGPQSIVWDEAENRLHSQKALLELLLT